MELKLDKNATVAMEQINLKNYPERFALCGLPVVKVAVNFDSESGTLGDWMIEKLRLISEYKKCKDEGHFL